MAPPWLRSVLLAQQVRTASDDVDPTIGSLDQVAKRRATDDGPAWLGYGRDGRTPVPCHAIRRKKKPPGGGFETAIRVAEASAL
jgi:hypothetical protein